MNQQTELTVKESLSKMYDQGIDHAIEIIKEEMLDGSHWQVNLVNPILKHIIEQLQNLKSK